MIPRRLAYRIWAACLGSQARRLRSLAGGGAAADARRRRGPGAAREAMAKSDARLEWAARLEREADTLAGWIARGGPPGGDLDPAIVGLVAAYLHQHAESVAALLRRAAARGRSDGPSPADAIDFVRWAMDAC